MTKRLSVVLTLMIAVTFFCPLSAQVLTNRNALTAMSKNFKSREESDLTRALQLAKQKGWFLRKITKNGGSVLLIGVDELGNPRYVTTYNNTIAAATTRASQLWPGGSSGLNLSGSSAAVKGKMAIWDGGHPLTTHVELTGRIALKDVGTVEGHATHTTGTMIATGINPIAKGMAFGAQQLLAYDFSNDASEMTAAAPALLISNHSYGFLSGSGWTFDGTNWNWYGDTTVSKSDAYGFGYYDKNAQLYDSIAYNAPYYLIDVAAGNARGYNGPAVDSSYLYNGNTKIKRSAILGNNPNFTSISNTADSKNTLVVGAVNGIPAGYNSPNDVTIAYFSSWGPTNDGRIKPDVVADGVDVTSTWNTSTTAYSTQSGTSMATPNVTGSLYLLQEYYDKLHPSLFMRSATLKALAIHTADEAGPAEGPDYVYGWGLLDALKGANVITSSYNQQADTIIESTLNNGATYTFNVVASGKGPLAATLVWTDPPGTPVAVPQSLHNTAPMLVNDLDMRITSGAQVYKPWVLDPANPSNPATRGDNFRDNVEKINVDSIVPGQAYTVTITHKGTLARGQQAFSLLVSGIGGQAYCASAPTSTAGTRIDSIGISNINIANPAGCTSYINNTKYTIQIQPKQKLPIRIRLGSCDASVSNKVVKVFIDYNNNGVFDANELAAQSSVMSGNAVYTDTISLPSLTKGNFTMLRIVAQETNDPSTVQACGSYGNGETDDFNVLVVSPANDLALAQVISPVNGACSDDAELVTIAIRNNGTDTASKVPVSAVIKNGSTTVATLNEVYPGKIPPGFLVTYTFQTTVATASGANYNVSAFVTSATDQNSANDTLTSTVSIAAAPAAPEATATVSGDTLHLTVTNPNPSSIYFWYASATSDTALFASTDTLLTLNSVPAGNTFYVGEGIKGTVGVKSKNDYQSGSGGGYQSPGNNFLAYDAKVPIVLNSAKLFTGNPGKIQLMVIDTLDTQPDGSYFYRVLSNTIIDVYATSPTPKPGSVSGNNPADNGAVFYINLSLPAGKHLILDSTIDATIDKTAIATASIFRNNNITGNPYPFTIPNVISITGNSATSASNPNQYQSYYYYLYDMKVQTADCVSDRTAVTVSVPSNLSFNVWPNPVTPGSNLNILFNAGSTGNFQIEVFDLLGRRYFSQNYSASGLFSTQVNVNSLVTGIYILVIREGSKLYKKKVLITK
ncbi:MAG: S8 family serine peptidase [Bacteroidetes bacterium]|nr:S8 family serine peptidase [Bacteroidota bacterium]MBS1973155.1 S8 family serine peptidase [Bacteroidota bacterium]